MDDGQVIPALGEDWTFMGAKLMEWVSGLAMAMIVSEAFLGNPVRSAPILVFVTVGTPIILSAIRRHYPDEERGVRNQLMVAMGVAPPGLPAPASLQPEWSGAPMRALDEECEYEQLHLDDLFDYQGDEG